MSNLHMALVTAATLSQRIHGISFNLVQVAVTFEPNSAGMGVAKLHREVGAIRQRDYRVAQAVGCAAAWAGKDLEGVCIEGIIVGALVPTRERSR